MKSNLHYQQSFLNNMLTIKIFFLTAECEKGISDILHLPTSACVTPNFILLCLNLSANVSNSCGSHST